MKYFRIKFDQPKKWFLQQASVCVYFYLYKSYLFIFILFPRIKNLYKLIILGGVKHCYLHLGFALKRFGLTETKFTLVSFIN